MENFQNQSLKILSALDLRKSGRLVEAVLACGSDDEELRLECESEVNKIEKALSKLVKAESPGGWLSSLEKSETDSLRAFYKHEDKKHHLRWEAVYNAEPHELLCVAREWDLFGKWNSYITETQILEAPSEFEVFASGQLWLPWPMTNRGLQFKCRGYDLLTSKEAAQKYGKAEAIAKMPPHLLILFESLFDEELKKRSSVEVSERAKALRENLVPLHIYSSIAQLVPVVSESGKIQTRLILTVAADPQLPTVPQWLVNIGLNVISPTLHRLVGQILTDILGKENCGDKKEETAGNKGEKKKETEEKDGKESVDSAITEILKSRLQTRAIYEKCRLRVNALKKK